MYDVYLYAVDWAGEGKVFWQRAPVESLCHRCVMDEGRFGLFLYSAPVRDRQAIYVPKEAIAAIASGARPSAVSGEGLLEAQQALLIQATPDAAQSSIAEDERVAAGKAFAPARKKK
jgi:hypothetical protein